ncbi:IS1 family transposase [Escherichia coli]
MYDGDFKVLAWLPFPSVELHDKVIGHYLNIKHYQ